MARDDNTIRVDRGDLFGLLQAADAAAARRWLAEAEIAWVIEARNEGMRSEVTDLYPADQVERIRAALAAHDGT